MTLSFFVWVASQPKEVTLASRYKSYSQSNFDQVVYVEDTRPDVVVVDQPAVVAPVAPVAPAGSPHFWEHFSFLGPFIQT